MTAPDLPLVRPVAVIARHGSSHRSPSTFPGRRAPQPAASSVRHGTLRKRTWSQILGCHSVLRENGGNG
jgi:hypothetical protein